jgi:hypothetical protein
MITNVVLLPAKVESHGPFAHFSLPRQVPPLKRPAQPPSGRCPQARSFTPRVRSNSFISMPFRTLFTLPTPRIASNLRGISSFHTLSINMGGGYPPVKAKGNPLSSRARSAPLSTRPASNRNLSRLQLRASSVKPPGTFPACSLNPCAT